MKLALICYLVIFSASYISTGTSAYYSSQSVVFDTITAGIWEETVKNACGEGVSNDNQIGTTQKSTINTDLSDEKNDADCEEIDVEDLDCKNLDKISEEVNGDDGEASDDINEDCESIDDQFEEVSDIDEVVEDEQATNQESTEENDGNIEVNLDGEQENPEEGIKKQPDNKDSTEIKAAEEDSDKKIDDELNVPIKQEQNTKKTEGDSNEQEENNEVD